MHPEPIQLLKLPELLRQLLKTVACDLKLLKVGELDNVCRDACQPGFRQAIAPGAGTMARQHSSSAWKAEESAAAGWLWWIAVTSLFDK